MSKHFFFVDDSGSKDWETPYSREFTENPPKRTDQNLNFWRRNYFVLGGIHVSGETVARLNPEINELKKRFFGTKHVEIKSDWLRNPHQRRKRYLEVFPVSEEQLRVFTEAWYRVFTENTETVQIQAFVLDKRYFRHKRDKYSPLQFSVQVLFDRIEMHPSQECVIVFDQMEKEIHSERNKQGVILKISDREINLGSFHEKYSHTRPRFERSSDSNFLQLADTAAYNVFRQFVNFGDQWERGDERGLRMYPFFERIVRNFYNKEGRVGGIGIVKIPDPEKIWWKRTALVSLSYT